MLLLQHLVDGGELRGIYHWQGPDQLSELQIAKVWCEAGQGYFGILWASLLVFFKDIEGPTLFFFPERNSFFRHRIQGVGESPGKSCPPFYALCGAWAAVRGEWSQRVRRFWILWPFLFFDLMIPFLVQETLV